MSARTVNVSTNVSWRISVNATTYTNEITVKRVSTDDSGLYSCHELVKFTRKVIFQLLVTGTTFHGTDFTHLIYNLRN